MFIDFVIAIIAKLWRIAMRAGVNKKQALVFLSSLVALLTSIIAIKFAFLIFKENSGIAWLIIGWITLIYGLLMIFGSILTIVIKDHLCSHLKSYELLRNEFVLWLKRFFVVTVLLFLLLVSRYLIIELVKSPAKFDQDFDELLNLVFYLLIIPLIYMVIIVGQMLPDEPPKKKLAKAGVKQASSPQAV